MHVKDEAGGAVNAQGAYGTVDAPGAYETHITVRCAGEDEGARLEAWAGRRGLKVTTIVLARGRTPVQPMLTLPDRTGHPALVEALRAAGFAPVRVKVETVPWSQEPTGPGGGYHEHHLKLALPSAYDHAALEALVVPHGAHLSWNARRALPGPGGRHERFVTQRHPGPAPAALRACDELLAALTAAGHEVIGEERELVLWDSDLSVDDGWLEPPATTPLPENPDTAPRHLETTA
ncbi:hypothetical protein [Streptomyces sp. NRRL F-5727]|uniref:hypothetical protein n=1 Tax=Streptomyces sp. NRRL F-5727 TaxID=1463871 RepID=UPI0007C80F8D|nr:hypothetical protein [Streptomyces sp. NRRL F-5727]